MTSRQTARGRWFNSSRIALALLGTFVFVACSKPGSGPGDTTGAAGATTAPNGSLGVIWARSAPSQAQAIFESIATDRTGNVYVAAGMLGPIPLDFGNGVTASPTSNGPGGLLMKYDPSGVAKWARTVGAASANESTFSSAAVDSKGNVYVDGYIGGPAGSLDFGDGVSFDKSDMSTDALLVKFSPSGSAQWVRVVGGGSVGSNFEGVGVDSADNVYAVGSVSGAGVYDLGNGVTTTGIVAANAALNSPDTAILVKYDSSGAAQWVRAAVGGSPQSDFGSVAIDREGNVYATGSIAGPGMYDFGNGVTVTGTEVDAGIAGLAGNNAVLVSYSSSGAPRWARTPTGSSNGSIFSSVAADSASGVYVAGSIGSGTYDFGNAVTAAGSVMNGVSIGSESPFYLMLAKFDSSGIAQWTATVDPGGTNSYLTSVAVDATNNVYVAGTVSSPGTYALGPSVALATGPQDAAEASYGALIKYGPSGIALWAQSSTNTDLAQDTFNSISLDSTGSLYMAGVISGPGIADFGNNVTVSTKTPDPGWSPLLLKYH